MGAGPGKDPPPILNAEFRIDLVHPAHAAGTAMLVAAAARVLLLLGDLRDERLGGQQERRDRRGVLQRAANDLRRVDDAGLHQVLVGLGRRVEALVLLHLADLRHHDGTLGAGVGRDVAHRLFDRALHDLQADQLIALELQLVEHLRRADQGHAAAGHDAFLDGRLGRVHRVLDARLLLLHLGFGGRTDLDDGVSADELRQPLLELLAVVVRAGLLDLRADLLDASLDCRRRSAALDDRRVVLVDGDLLGLAEVLELDVLELEAEIFRDGLATREDRDVFEHRLAAIAEARRLDGRRLQRAAQLVDHEGRERFAVDVFRDDHERLARAGDLLEQRQEVLHRADLLLVDQDDAVLEHHFHALRIRDEVGREVAAVELHALDDLERGLHRARFLDRDHAVLADLVHRFRDDVAAGVVAVRRDRADLADHLAADFLRHLLELRDDGLDGLLDALLQLHRVRARDDVLRAFAVDRLRQHGRRRRAVTGRVRRLARDFAHHLRAHVLERVLELDLLGDGHAVLGDRRRAELLVEDDVAALRAESDLDRVGQGIDAAQDRLARIFTVNDLFSHDLLALHDAENFFLTHDEEFLAIKLDLLSGVLAEENRVANLDVERRHLAVLLDLALARGDDLALLRLFLGGVGDDDAADFLFAFFEARDDDAVVKRSDLHGSNCPFECVNRGPDWHSAT